MHLDADQIIDLEKQKKNKKKSSNKLKDDIYMDGLEDELRDIDLDPPTIDPYDDKRKKKKQSDKKMVKVKPSEPETKIKMSKDGYIYSKEEYKKKKTKKQQSLESSVDSDSVDDIIE